MRVKVDRTRCQGHNRCVALAPQVFDTDDEGMSVVLTEEVLPEQHDRARRAEQACPERAISIEE